MDERVVAHGGVAAEPHHPTALTYVKIAIVLAILTISEVVVWYLPIPDIALTLMLIVLSIAKFVLVVGYYMHLKTDSRLYTGMFVWGLCVAIAIVLTMMALYGSYYIT